MTITYRDILEQIARDRGDEPPHPIRLSGTDNGQLAYESEGTQIFFQSWKLPKPPTANERDSAIKTLASTIVLGDDAPSNVVSRFPESPQSFERIIHAGKQFSQWHWNPYAGAGGEWWGEPWEVQFGHNAVTRANTYFRMFGYVPNQYRGIPLTEQYRILRVTGQWWQKNVSGVFQVRSNGVSDGRDIKFSGDRIDYAPPVEANQWKVGKDTGELRNLGCVWTGKGRLSGHNIRIKGIRIWTSN